MSAFQNILHPIYIALSLYQIVRSDAPFGSVWYTSTKDITLIKNPDYTQWNLTKSHGEDINIITQLSYNDRQSIASVGNVARFEMIWNSDGMDKCPSQYWTSPTYNYQCEELPQQWIESCAHQSVHCLAGTGDFRIALLQSNNKTVTSNGYSNDIFNEMLGYNFHIFPHLSVNAVEYHDNRSGEGYGAMVPCNFDFKGSETDPFTNHRIEYNASIGCFQTPLNYDTQFKLELRREKEYEIEMVMEMNNVSRSYKHQWSESENKYIPQYIDTVAICYPNERMYYYMRMKKT
eukprot:216835_1